MTALANRQLATNNFIGDLREKLSEVEAEWKALRNKSTDTEYRLQGIEAMLEKARGEADGEWAPVVALLASLEEVKSQQESMKEKVASDTVAAYLESEAFNDEMMEYFISGFKTLRR